MSKRFFSLLLVLAMVLSLAIPGFAASDETQTVAADDQVATIELNGLDLDFEKETSSGGAIMRQALRDAELYLNLAGRWRDEAARSWYTPESLKVFDDAYQVAYNLRLRYENDAELRPSSDEYLKAGQALTAAIKALNYHARQQDTNELLALIDDAMALLEEVGYPDTIFSPGEEDRWDVNRETHCFGVLKNAILHAYFVLKTFGDFEGNPLEPVRTFYMDPTGIDEWDPADSAAIQGNDINSAKDIDGTVRDPFYKDVRAEIVTLTAAMNTVRKLGSPTPDFTNGTYEITDLGNYLVPTDPIQANGLVSASIYGFRGTTGSDADERAYRVTAKLNGENELVYCGSWDYASEGLWRWTPISYFTQNDRFNGVTNLEAVPNSLDLSIANTSFHVSKFKETDVVTFTLYVFMTERNTQGGYWQAVKTIDITCSEAAKPALAVAGKGFVADETWTDKDGRRVDVTGTPVVDDGHLYFDANGDRFYITLNRTYAEVLKNFTAETEDDYAGLYWKFSFPAGVKSTSPAKSYTIAEPQDGGGVTWRYYDGSNGKVSGITFSASAMGVVGGTAGLKPGTYTFYLMGIKQYDAQKPAYDPNKEPVTILTVTIDLPALNKQPLIDYMKEEGVYDPKEIAQNFGPYGNIYTPTGEYGENVTKLLQLVDGKVVDWDRGILLWLQNEYPATKGNIAQLGYPTDHSPYGGTYLKSWFHQLHDIIGMDIKDVLFDEDITDTVDHNSKVRIYSVKELRAIINEIKALNPADYRNWESGLMKNTLDIAESILEVVTTKTYLQYDQTPLKDYNKTWERRLPALGLSPYEKFCELSKKDIANLVDALTVAKNELIADKDKMNGLVHGSDGKLYYYIDDVLQKSGYTLVNGVAYYFSVKDGHALKNGVVTGENGKQYVADANGVLQKGFCIDKKGDAYYCSVKDHHIFKNGRVHAGGWIYYICGKDGKLQKDLQTATVKGVKHQFFCSNADYHIFRALKNTAVVTGKTARYRIDHNGYVLATLALS